VPSIVSIGKPYRCDRPQDTLWFQRSRSRYTFAFLETCSRNHRYRQTARQWLSCFGAGSSGRLIEKPAVNLEQGRCRDIAKVGICCGYMATSTVPQVRHTVATWYCQRNRQQVLTLFA
jgi:hypothetical protein